MFAKYVHADKSHRLFEAQGEGGGGLNMCIKHTKEQILKRQTTLKIQQNKKKKHFPNLYNFSSMLFNVLGKCTFSSTVTKLLFSFFNSPATYALQLFLYAKFFLLFFSSELLCFFMLLVVVVHEYLNNFICRKKQQKNKYIQKKTSST